MRMLRLIARAVLIVLVLGIGAIAAAALVSQTAWFKNWLRGYVVAQGSRYLNGELSIGKLSGSLFSDVHFDDVAITMDGTPVVQVESLSLSYNLLQLATRNLSLDELRLNKPVVYLRHDNDGWSISRLVKKQAQEADRTGPGSPITIEAVAISDGAVFIEDER